MSVNKLERLLNLTAVLLDTRRLLTAEELRQKVEGYPPPGPAFHRAFERDKDDLRVLGIPLTVEKVPTTDPPIDGYRIDPDQYYLPDPGLEPDELAALHLASLTVRLEGLEDREALWKLGGVDPASHLDVGPANPSPAAPESSGVVASLPTDPALTPLFEAITRRRTVLFTHKGQERRLDPWRLDFQRGRWYVSGFDHLRQDERNFRLDRIDGTVTVTDEASDSRPSQPRTQPLQAWEIGSEAPTKAKLWIDSTRVESAARHLGPTVSRVGNDDGSAVFEIEVVNFQAFRTFVLGFLDRAEVLEPPQWRSAIVDWLAAIADGTFAGPDDVSSGVTTDG